MIQRRVWIAGLVQGVGFRAATAWEAQKYPTLLGYVKNLEDGRVEAVFAGEESEVQAMLTWCKKGPPSSRVKSIEIKEESLDASLQKFKIEMNWSRLKPTVLK